MPEPGQMISHYRILQKIGQGGMGEVYLADDLSLDRKVALKFLPDVFTGDSERMARFEREAKLLASLNHPNIAAIYGLEQADGKRFLIMEYVAGETLQARVSKGALPVEDALGVCRQIAEGLEAAHEKGVIHRDLKPANVMITAEEKVKILDFGLAKALLDEGQSVDSSQSPTITEAMTQPGVVLGTAAYMSPEQAKGKPVDKRADIWAFGCILYECLTGKKAFAGETVTETLASVIKEEPHIETAPANVRLLLRQCLAKDRKNRLRDIGDAMTWIEYSPEAAAPESVPQKRPWPAWSIAALLFMALAALSFLYFLQGKAEPAEVRRYQIGIPDQVEISGAGWSGWFAVSPNGRHLAFLGINPDGERQLYIRDLDSFETNPIVGSEFSGVYGSFFWSPDSRFIAFDAVGKLKKIDINSGQVISICDLPELLLGGSWNREGVILLGFNSATGGIKQVSEDGGAVLPVTQPSREFQDFNHSFPVFLPDGRHFIYFCLANDPERMGVYIGLLDSKPEEQNTERLMPASAAAAYVPSGKSDPGKLLFLQGETLSAQLFDDRNLKLIGEPKFVAEPVYSVWGYSYFSVSNNVLVYRTKVDSQLTWIDRDGQPLRKIGEPDDYETFDLSNDGELLVLSKTGTEEWSNLHVMDLQHGDTLIRLTRDEATHVDPRWSHDNRTVFFGSTADFSRSPFRETFPSSYDPEQVFKFEGAMFSLNDVSPDGNFLLYHDSGQREFWVKSIKGEEAQESVVLMPSGVVDQAQFSPDGRWIAFHSDVSGNYEVYVTQFPQTGSNDKKPISREGGAQPTWRADGRELYFLTPDGTLMAVDVDTRSDELVQGKIHSLFKTQLQADYNVEQYLPHPDGTKFLFLNPAIENRHGVFNIILNWPSLLEQ